MSSSCSFPTPGPGVNPEAAPFIFERFQQADGGIQRRYGGLGIGLSVVRNLFEMQGGRVRVESPGRDGGATFIVSLPASATPMVLPAPPAVRDRPTPDELQAAKELRRSFRLLIVDDVQDTLHLMERVLARAGFDVATAASATAAIASAHSHAPDALISDLSMPDCDGLELLRQLRAEAGLTNLPAVAVSGFTGESERAAAIQSGFNAYFTKPLDVPQLLEPLDRLLLAAPPHKARGKARSTLPAKS
ncbi:MAG: response regulator [Verrucomicrobiota bacterium]|nr:response regulator [Verrucomicrobiota bacterium]